MQYIQDPLFPDSDIVAPGQPSRLPWVVRLESQPFETPATQAEELPFDEESQP